MIKTVDLVKVFRTDEVETVALNGVNLEISQGDFLAVMGPSGCGKSTILNILAGLDAASEGLVIMDGKEVAGPSLERGVVFQNYSLLLDLRILYRTIGAVIKRSGAY